MSDLWEPDTDMEERFPDWGHRIWLRAPGGYWKAHARYDGCVEVISDEDDFIHICDLDEMILRLEDIQRRAKQKWGDHWPR